MTKRIKNPEQAAKERDLRYNQLIIDGEDAEAVFKYVYKLKKEASGGVQSFISLSRFREYLIPLPPVAEQNRIVAKLEEILPLCERLK